MQALFRPDFPELELYTIVAVFNHLEWFATLDAQADFDFAVAWQDQTWSKPDPVLDAIAKSRPVINHHCIDISKRKVEEISLTVFGHNTLIDPVGYSGACVKKPDENAAERGSIVQCPLESAEPGYVYQTLIDTRGPDGMRNEYRVPVVFGGIPCVYLQKKPDHPEQAKTVPASTQLLAADEVFTAEEQQQIGEFCAQIRLDFGDLDILRDVHSGQVHIIDANKTGGGFGLLNRFRWSAAERRQAIASIAAAFEHGVRARL